MKIPTAEKEGKLVLIAERDPFVRRYLENFFKRFRCECEIAQDGATVLKRAKFRTPDLIVLDVLLPKLDGISLCRLIRADQALSKIPLVFFSSVDVSKEALVAGATGFLMKPFDEKSFSNLVAPYLQPPEAAKS